MPKYGASWHWAKIEDPGTEGERAAMRAQLAARFPLERFAAARAAVDPKGILGSPALDQLIAPSRAA